MLSRKRRDLLLMIAAAAVAILSALLVAEEWKPSQAYKETVNRIEELRGIRNLSPQEKLKRVDELENMTDEEFAREQGLPYP